MTSTKKAARFPGHKSRKTSRQTILFLLTPGALALTGQTLPVDAGFVFT